MTLLDSAAPVSERFEMVETNVPASPPDELETLWRVRENEWRRKLGRLRLGVEPIEEQLARYRRVTWALTVIPSVPGLMFVSLFTIFGHPEIGLVFVAILLLPIVLGAWFDYALLANRARRYRVELADYLRDKELRIKKTLESSTTSEPA
jgi:hypothetical protein